jgi:small redox-active disulfide protein 2
MRIEILGMGCAKCKKLAAAAEEAVRLAGVEAEVVKVENVADIARYGVMMTPALVVDGVVKSSGKVPTPAKIAEMLKAAGPAAELGQSG